ncbi:assembly of actin patch protein [Microbotryomycetes sp. JL201]|nr:assembly of actin patch protein [Microbotryomycetes sp. JL201]
MSSTYPYQAVATLKYKSPPGSGSSVQFAKGERVTVTGQADDEGDWLQGTTLDGTQGVFPSSFVQKVDGDDENDGEERGAPTRDSDTLTEAAATTAKGSSAAVDMTSQTNAAEQDVSPEPAASKPAGDGAGPALGSATARPNSPPEAPKKPSSLRDRIAAFNAAGAQPPPPVPRATKPFVFKKPVTTETASSTSPPSAQPTTISPPPFAHTSATSPTSAAVDEKASTTNKAFSAEDARESIGKGGSLKDRIAALQGMTLDTPSAPGRAPKPWKKKSIEVEGEQEQSAAGTAETALETEVPVDEADGQVKDERPDECETTAQSESAHVPGFEPAEEEEQSKTTDDAVEQARKPEPFVAQPLEDNDNMDGTAPSPCDTNFEEPARQETAESSHEADEGEQDEKDKRAAIAARMAGLGGQRVGMAMPALPKRAGPPRRKPAAAAGPEPVETPKTSADALPTTALATQEPEESAKMGSIKSDAGVAAGASAGVATGAGLLAATKENADHEAKGADEDDFDTPALPKPSPPPATVPAPSSSADQDGSNEHELEPVEPAEPELADDEADSGGEPTSEQVAGVPPPLPVGRPPMPPPMTSDVDEVVDDRASHQPLLTTTHEIDSGVTETSPPPISPLAPGRPPIPVVPASFDSPQHETEQDPMASTLQRDVAVAPGVSGEESTAIDGPSSPVPTRAPPPPVGRPAIPAIPATFATTTVSDESDDRRPIDIPRGEPAVLENTVEDDVAQAEIAADDGEESGQQADVEDETAGATPPPPPPGRPVPPPSADGAIVGQPSTLEESRPAESTRPEEDGEAEEEEEEDPELARRRAIAARMAKLGGMNMRMGPMIPPIGGIRKPPASAVKKQKEEDEQGSPDFGETADRETTGRGAEDSDAPPAPRRIPGFPAGGFALPGIAPIRPPPSAAAEEDDAEAQEESVRADQEEEKLTAQPQPPPLPTGRPSVPTLATPNDDQTAEPEPMDREDGPSTSSPPPLPVARPPVIASKNVAEPEQLETADDEDEQESAQESAPQPPPRPAGGLPPPPPASGPPPVPTEARETVPTSPVSKSSGVGFGLFKPKSRQGSVPSIEPVTSRTSIDAPSRSSFEGGEVYRSNSVHSSGAKPLPAVDESANITVAAPPPSSNLDPAQLVQFSTTLGAQVFAAAHTRLNDKGAKESRGGQGLLEFCLARATNPRMPNEFVYGETVLHVEGGKGNSGKSGGSTEIDEPRAGDVVVFHDTKFKHNLTTSRVGSAQSPFAAVVASWDSKKRKLKTIEVNVKDNQVEEGSHRLEDLKQGHVIVYRVVPNPV